MRTLVLALALATAAAIRSPVAAADGSSQHHGAGTGAASHYVGMEERAIKALSPQQLADLRAGRGMGLALPAELNGYPGPAHVLELAGPLRLTADQLARTQALFDAMTKEAKALGEDVIAQEAALEALFATRAATAETLRAALLRAAERQSLLRYTHLRYHLAMLDVLTPEQVARYGELRGYAAAHRPGHHR